MPYKSRTEQTELLTLKSLNTRMDLSEKDKQYYYNLEKGYEGEKIFDTLIEKLQCECFILNDLLLKLNNTLFQIDSLIITQEINYLFEVKNYEGDYYYESERLYVKPKSEINNPLNQLNRSESLLRQLLQNLGYNAPVSASVVFINSEFNLYQSPLNKPFTFPTQIKRYLKTLNSVPSKLNIKHKILADKLISLHIKDSPINQIPAYNYDQLRKGITCVKCTSFAICSKRRNIICKECGHEEVFAAAIMRNVKEYKLLFSDHKITTNSIHDWSNLVNSKKRIRKVLEKHFKKVGVHQWTYYE